MSEQERSEQPPETQSTEQQPKIADLAQPELDPEQAEQTKGGIVFGANFDEL